jgi:hypothetical protein
MRKHLENWKELEQSSLMFAISHEDSASITCKMPHLVMVL